MKTMRQFKIREWTSRFLTEFLASVGQVESLLPSRRAQADTAEMQRLVEGVQLVHAAEQDEANPIRVFPDSDQSVCPCCRARHCHIWRSTGNKAGCGGHVYGDGCHRPGSITGDQVELPGCGGEGEAPAWGVPGKQVIDDAIASPGRHTLQYVVAHWAAWSWNPIPLRVRVLNWPSRYEAKLGRPVQLARR